MEYLDGETLSARIKAPRPARRRHEVVPLVDAARSRASAPRTPPGSSTAISSPTTSSSCKEKAGRRDFVKILDFGVSKFAEPLMADGGLWKISLTFSRTYLQPCGWKGYLAGLEVSPEGAFVAKLINCSHDLGGIQGFF